MRALTCLLIVGIAFSAMAVASTTVAQDVAPPNLTLEVLQAEGWVGARMTWHVTLTPVDAISLEKVTMHSADPTVWRLVEPVALFPSVESPVTLAIPVVPLQQGPFTPALRIRYQVNGKESETLVRASSRVDVYPVTDGVTASLLSSAPVRVGESVTMTFEVVNKTPFSLQDVEAAALESGMRWTSLPASFDLLPGASDYRTVTARVREADSTPYLRLTYSWRDDLDVLRTHTQTLKSSSEVSQATFWAKIPTEIMAVFFGVLSSVITTALTRLLEQRLERKAKHEVNRRHVLGLLNLMLTRAEYAADHGEKLELDPLETLMKEESLYTVLDHNKLTESVQALWKTGEAHNRGLTKPDGQLRTEQLRRVKKQVEHKLDPLRKGK